jgi:hypothetical protein
LFAGLDVFPVKDPEGPQADVSYFLLGENDCITRCARQRYIRWRCGDRRGGAARQRQRHADGSHDWYRVFRQLALRSLLVTWHSRGPLMPLQTDDRRSYILRMASAPGKTNCCARRSCPPQLQGANGRLRGATQ